MYARLALKNVRKSFRDYAIYFLTLMFGVCIFYMFNAIESQAVMMKLSDTQNQMISNLVELIAYLSIFVAVILGFLIVYANKFLVKRRKKELGMYMLLGMNKWKISAMLTMETFCIGVCSLVSGLASGIFLSQGLSVFTAKLFEADMTAFSFVFSNVACFKTLGYFGVIYMIVALFNIGTLSQSKLIHLIYGDKENEKPRMKNLGVSVLLFIVSIICLIIAYYCIIKNGLMVIDAQFFAAFIFCFIGTVLFFMSLTGFFLKVIQSGKKGYYKELNVFILKQINSKINTNCLSMIIICLLLAVTIVSLSSGMAMKQSISEELKAITPYDVSLSWKDWGDADRRKVEIGNVEELFTEAGIKLREYAEGFETYSFYETTVIAQAVLEGQKLKGSEHYLLGLETRTFDAMTVSDYNKLAILQGKEKIELGPNEFAVSCDYQKMIPLWNAYLRKNNTIAYNGKTLTSAYSKVLNTTLCNNLSRNNPGVLIVPDKIIDTTKKVEDVVSFYYKSPELEAELRDEIRKQISKFASEKDIAIGNYSKDILYDASIGSSAIMVYLTVYMSIVFLITSAAILALGQLTEAEDNKKRYELLAKLGADEKMINKALFKQIGIYFIVPLSLALVHGVVGIFVANDVIRLFGEVDILRSIAFTACIFVVIYGGYFVATYYNSKKLIHK